MAYRFCVVMTLLGLAAPGCVDLTRPMVDLADGGRDRAPIDRPAELPPGSEVGGGPDDGPDGPEPPDMDTDTEITGGDGPDTDLPPDAPLLANGKRCSATDQCESRQCVDGFCCNSACGDLCQACHLTGSEGTCTAVPAGQDPRENCAQDPVSSCGRDGTCNGQGACRRYPATTECAPGGCSGNVETAASTCDGNGACTAGSTRSCAPNMCTGGSCAATCTTQTQCQTGFFCDGTRCTLKRTPGVACTMAFQCASGVCIDGVCCGGPCSQPCHACNVAGALGTCTPIPSGQDPQNECPGEAAATCGRAGGCNGLGGCRLHASGTMCNARTCAGSTETAASTCNGAGVCLMGTTRSCAPYQCGAGACATTCTSSSQCLPGNYCSAAGACVPFGAGPRLYWKFDESNGTVAIDSSGGGFNGTYTGVSGVPTTSIMVAPVRFPNPSSRSFNASSRQAVRISNAPAALRPTNNYTIALWFRTTTLDTGHADGSPPGPRASEALSLGDNYFIRIRGTDIAFTRRIATVYVSAFATMTGHLDGDWHHVAAVVSPAGMKLYYDGVERGSSPRGENNIYDQGGDLNVGRHGTNDPDWDFAGNIDDVRLYTRALAGDEIAAIADGFF